MYISPVSNLYTHRLSDGCICIYNLNYAHNYKPLRLKEKVTITILRTQISSVSFPLQHPPLPPDSP